MATTNTASPSHSVAARRGFIASALALAGGLAWWSARKPAAAAAEAGAAGMVTIVPFTDAGVRQAPVTVPKVVKTDAEWQKQLSAIEFAVARKEGTERPFTGKTWNLHDKGLYRCICCDNALYDSETKFESGTGWPSFWQPIAEENIVKSEDRSFMMVRTAISCKRCDAHLGHVFDDGPKPTGLRYCMNSAAMKFVKRA
jgi:peptide-methionine (R)-S-oxide reductase